MGVFNYDPELDEAFKAIQRKVQAGEPIAVVPELPADHDPVRDLERRLRARIVAFVEQGSRSGKESREDPATSDERALTRYLAAKTAFRKDADSFFICAMNARKSGSCRIGSRLGSRANNE